ncbi:hypothetical protein MBAV_001780 [Candidatus Magnetobacterium bavaricum]|uniref:Uncharacterized protein n=1 Tax=Candidatus Magnetobacterium bavaricum TaxID=29290 RepID=A0A0F3GVY9_9BACT|nr:hypothetical protein MBAV_001780 [Candidatus Magnetobacterium bavaricum]
MNYTCTFWKTISRSIMLIDMELSELAVRYVLWPHHGGNTLQIMFTTTIHTHL